MDLYAVTITEPACPEEQAEEVVYLAGIYSSVEKARQVCLTRVERAALGGPDRTLAWLEWPNQDNPDHPFGWSATSAIGVVYSITPHVLDKEL